MNASPAGSAACCLQSGRWDPWWLRHALPFSIAVPNGGSCRHSTGLSTAQCSTHPRSAAPAATIIYFSFSLAGRNSTDNFLPKFPQSLLLFWFSEHSFLLLIPLPWISDQSFLPVLCCLYLACILTLSFPSLPSAPSHLVALQSSREGLKPSGALQPSPCISAAAQDGIWADEVYVWLVRMMPPPPIPPVRATPPPRPDN